MITYSIEISHLCYFRFPLFRKVRSRRTSIGICHFAIWNILSDQFRKNTWPLREEGGGGHDLNVQCPVNFAQNLFTDDPL